MHQYPASISAWKEKIEWFVMTPQYRELDRIDGEPTEFEWAFFPGLPGRTTLQILVEIQKMMDEMQCELDKVTGRIALVPMSYINVWGSKDQKESP